MPIDVSTALAPDAPVVTNENGGKQSHSPYGFHLLPTSAMFAVAELALTGANKYGESFGDRNYVKIPSYEHANHALSHIYAFLAGDKTDDHAVHAALRCLFMVDTKLREEAENEEIKKAEASVYEALQSIATSCSKMNGKETVTTAHNCSCTHCTCHDNEDNPLTKLKKNIAFDVWEALEIYRHCITSDPDYDYKAWFGVDCAFNLLTKDIIDYACVDLDYHSDDCYSIVFNGFEKFYENLDKSIPLNSDELKPMIDTFIDQLAEEFVTLYEEENEFDEEYEEEEEE